MAAMRKRDLEEVELISRDLEHATDERFHAEDDCEDDRPDHAEQSHRIADDGRDLITRSTVGALSHHLHHRDADTQIEQGRVREDRPREDEDSELTVAQSVHDECRVSKPRHHYEAHAQVVPDDAADNLRCPHRAGSAL